MIINLIDKNLKISKSWILLYNNYASEIVEKEAEIFNEKGFSPLKAITEMFGDIVDRYKLISEVDTLENFTGDSIEEFEEYCEKNMLNGPPDLPFGGSMPSTKIRENVKIITNIDPYNCSILELKGYIFYLSGIEVPKQYLYDRFQNPVGTHSNMDYDISKIHVEESDEFTNISHDLSIVSKDLTEINILNFDDFFSTQELNINNKNKYGKIKLFFPLIYHTLASFLNGDTSQYPHIFANRSLIEFNIQNNHLFRQKSTDVHIDSYLTGLDVFIPSSSKEKPILSCRNLLETYKLKNYITFMKLVFKNKGDYFSIMRFVSDKNVRRKKIEDRETISIMEEFGNPKEILMFNIDKPNYRYGLHIDEYGNAFMRFSFKDHKKIMFRDLDIIVKEEFKSILNKTIKTYSVRNAIVAYDIENSEVNIVNFQEALEKVSVETNIISSHGKDYFFGSGISSVKDEGFPYINFINPIDFSLKISEINKNNIIALSFINKLTVSVSNITNEFEQEFVLRIIDSLLAYVEFKYIPIVGSNIKKLRALDPVLYKVPGKTFAYSRGCQQKYQPEYRTKDEFNKMSDEEKERTKLLKNHTTGGFDYYFCPNKEFPHLNFIGGHPDGLCAPCCHIKPEDPEVLNACTTTGIFLEKKRKSKKTSSYSYLPTATNVTERERTYIIPNFTDNFGLYGIALDTKVNNFIAPALDALSILEDKSISELIKESEIHKLDNILSEISDFSEDLSYSIDSLLLKNKYTPIYIQATESDLYVKTIRGGISDNYILIYEFNKMHFLITFEQFNYFKDKEYCIFSNQDEIIKYIFQNTNKEIDLSLNTIEILSEQDDFKYKLTKQILNSQDKVIGVILDNKYFLCISKSFQNTKYPVSYTLSDKEKFIPLDAAEYIINFIDKSVPKKYISFKDEVIGMNVFGINIFIDKNKESIKKKEIEEVKYNIRDLFLAALRTPHLLSVFDIEKNLVQNSKRSIFKIHMYKLVLLNLLMWIHNNSSISEIEKIDKTLLRGVLDKVITFKKIDTGNIDLGNVLYTCDSDLEYCDKGKLIIDAKYKSELIEILYNDIQHNNILEYVNNNKDDYKIIERYKFIKNINETIIYYRID